MLKQLDVILDVASSVNRLKYYYLDVILDPLIRLHLASVAAVRGRHELLQPRPGLPPALPHLVQAGPE